MEEVWRALAQGQSVVRLALMQMQGHTAREQMPLGPKRAKQWTAAGRPVHDDLEGEMGWWCTRHRTAKVAAACPFIHPDRKSSPGHGVRLVILGIIGVVIELVPAPCLQVHGPEIVIHHVLTMALAAPDDQLLTIHALAV